MRSTIRKIGNSRGVLIPAALLAECGISDQINLRVEGKCIVIEPIRGTREGWFPTPLPDADTDFWADLPADADCEDWVW
jgi:antitoxin MazE